MSSINVTALIVAGGLGSRMEQTTPKQFLIINDLPLIVWTLKPFTAFSKHMHIVIVVHKDYIMKMQDILKNYVIPNPVTIVEGGATRFHSVQNGLTKIPDDHIVLIHDAARCLISQRFIKHCVHEATQHDNAIPYIASRDSMRMKHHDTYQPIDRQSVMLIQTPQTFLAQRIKSAYQQTFQPHFTDEATVYETQGHRLHFIEGEPYNIKVTYMDDLTLVSSMLL